MTPVKTCRLLLVTLILARTAIAEQIPDHEPGMAEVREAMDRGVAYLVRHQYRDRLNHFPCRGSPEDGGLKSFSTSHSMVFPRVRAVA